jgi:hypothetical protein
MLGGMTDLPEGLHGAYLRADLVAELGVPAFRRLLYGNRLVRFSRFVLVDRARLPDLPTRAAAALLTAGPQAVLTSHTAALLFGCTSADAGTIHLLAPYTRQLRRRADVVLHQGLVDEQDVVELDGLRTLALEAVITEMLCTVARDTALACADQALASLEPFCRGEFKAEVSHRLATRRDIRWRARAETLLELATGLPESPAEGRLLLTLVDAGLPRPESQVAVCDADGRERYRLDFAWREPMVALEYDGHAAHAGRGEWDAARDEDLGRRGWLVLRAAARDLRSPARMLSELGRAFRVRRFSGYAA